MKLSNALAPILLAGLLAACASPSATTRVPTAAEPMPSPPARPQSMAATPLPPTSRVDPRPSAAPQVPVQAMSEAERTETLRSTLGAPRSFTPPAQHPAPAASAPATTVYVDREIRYEPRYETRYVPAHVHTASCSPGCTLGRALVYTGIGAIIGHQFHHRGRGAAIGAGLALLTGPSWCGWSSWCDD